MADAARAQQQAPATAPAPATEAAAGAAPGTLHLMARFPQLLECSRLASTLPPSAHDEATIERLSDVGFGGALLCLTGYLGVHSWARRLAPEAVRRFFAPRPLPMAAFAAAAPIAGVAWVSLHRAGMICDQLSTHDSDLGRAVQRVWRND